MNKSLILVWHLLVTLAKLLKPGGARAVIAENILMRQQLIIMTRHQNRSPKLSPSDKFLFGYLSLFLKHSRLLKFAITLKPSTLLRLHKVLVKGKYSALFSSAMTPRKPGPKGPSKELITAIVEMKQHNPRFGCPKNAFQISNVFGVELNKEVVRRVHPNHYRLASGDDGPSWLTLLGHTKDSLWSRNAGPIDLFRCESIKLKSHWVRLVMDQFTRRIVGFGVHAGNVDGPTLCRIFNSAITKQNLPNYLSSDNGLPVESSFFSQ